MEFVDLPISVDLSCASLLQALELIGEPCQRYVLAVDFEAEQYALETVRLQHAQIDVIVDSGLDEGAWYVIGTDRPIPRSWGA
mgnify:CR=1 FL=1